MQTLLLMNSFYIFHSTFPHSLHKSKYLLLLLIRESSDSHSQRGTRTSALSFPGRSSVPLEILQNSPFTRRHPELEMTGTSGRRDQWVKEISCCWPTWPLLSCIPDNRVSACAHMCVCALRVSGKRQTARQNKAILLSCYFYITFSVTFQ